VAVGTWKLEVSTKSRSIDGIELTQNVRKALKPSAIEIVACVARSVLPRA
jgi:hypothetical protein